MDPLRVVTGHRPPLVFVEQGDRASIYSGYLIELLPALLQHAGVNASYSIYHIDGGGGARNANGSWSGVMGELVSGRADLALFPLTLTTQRAAAIAHTTPYMDDGYGMLVRQQKLSSGYSFLQPFASTTWLMVLAALVGVMLMLIALDAVTRRARLRAFEREHGPVLTKRRRKRDKAMGHAIETIMMAVGSGSAPTSRSWAVKLMFICWAIFCVIMLSAYTANLTAHLTVAQMGSPISSVLDLASMSQPFGVPAQSSVSAYFRHSSDKAAQAVLPKMVEFKSVDAGAEALRSGLISAFICDFAVGLYQTFQPPCNLVMAPESIGSGALVIGLRPNSTLAGPLNSALLQLGEAGYLADLRRKWLVEASQCGADAASGAEDSNNTSLSPDQAWSVFLVLAGGVVLSVLIALVEVLYYRRFFSPMERLRQEVSQAGTRATLKRRMLYRSAVDRIHKSFSSGHSRPPDLQLAAPPAPPSDAAASTSHTSSVAPTAAAEVSVYVPGGGKDASLLHYKHAGRHDPQHLQQRPQLSAQHLSSLQALPPRLCDTQLQQQQQHHGMHQGAGMHQPYRPHNELGDDSTTCSSDDGR